MIMGKNPYFLGAMQIYVIESNIANGIFRPELPNIPKGSHNTSITEILRQCWLFRDNANQRRPSATQLVNELGPEGNVAFTA